MISAILLANRHSVFSIYEDTQALTRVHEGYKYSRQMSARSKPSAKYRTMKLRSMAIGPNGSGGI